MATTDRTPAQRPFGSLTRWFVGTAPAARSSPAPAAAPIGELQSLLVASGAGDRQAFEALYRLTSGRLLAVIRRSVWHRGEADEVLQELYVRIWRHAGEYDPARAQPMAWLGRIARNLAVDHLRRNGSRNAHECADDPAREGEEALSALAHCADPGPTPPEQLETRQLSAQAVALLAELNEGQRQALLLTFWEGLSQTEVAERLGLPVGTVKSTIRRSLIALKASIERREVLAASSAARASHAYAHGQHDDLNLGWMRSALAAMSLS